MNQVNEFVMHASFFPHRALMRDTEMLNRIAGRIDSLSKLQLSQLSKWYEFYWNMMEEHHQAEDDIMFVAIEKRLNAPSESIEHMETEHNRLQFLIDEIKRLIGEAVRENGSVLKIKEQLSACTKELLQLFTSHIGKEEKYVVEKMTAHFTPAEQRAIENRVKRKAPVKYLSYMIPWLHESLSAEENQQFDASLPRVVKLLNHFFWKGKYERLITPVRSMI